MQVLQVMQMLQVIHVIVFISAILFMHSLFSCMSCKPFNHRNNQGVAPKIDLLLTCQNLQELLSQSKWPATLAMMKPGLQAAMLGVGGGPCPMSIFSWLSTHLWLDYVLTNLRFRLFSSFSCTNHLDSRPFLIAATYSLFHQAHITATWRSCFTPLFGHTGWWIRRGIWLKLW